MPLDSTLTLTSIVSIAVVAAPLGLLAGVLPGVGGKTALAVCTPLLLSFDPLVATLFLIAMHGVVRIGGALPAVVLGVPGSSADAALIVHGHSLTVAGRSQQAINAAVSAGALGGVIGLVAFVMLSTIGGQWMLGWAQQNKVYAYFLAFAVIIATEKKGMVVAGVVLAVGCLLSLGVQPRITQREVSIFAIMMGVVAVPSLIFVGQQVSSDNNLSNNRTRGRIQQENESRNLLSAQGRTARFEVVRYKTLAVCAAMGGWLVGLIPGIGSTSLSWIVLTLIGKAHADPDGDVRGVIAPIAATSAKDGGSLSTTLLLGIPGSSSMLLLVGAMMLYSDGDVAGLTQHLLKEITGAAAIMMLTIFLAMWLAPWLGGYLTRIHVLPPAILRAGTLVMIALSVCLTLPTFANMVTLLLASLLGLLLCRLDMPTVPLVLGLILGADTLSTILGN